MTGVLILGTSHAAVFRGALPGIAARHPGLPVTVWALPGGVFAGARLRDGHLTPADAEGLRKARAWNGSETADLSGAGAIFLVGLRFALRQVLVLLGGVQPAEAGVAEAGAAQAGGGRIAVSPALIRDGIDALVAPAVDAICAQLGGLRVTALPAPYPARAAATPGHPGHEPPLARAAAHPAAAALMQLYHDRIAAALAQRGHAFCPQPPDTLAAPFLTRDDLLGGTPKGDLRHMNTAYALRAFDALLHTPGAPGLSTFPTLHPKDVAR